MRLQLDRLVLSHLDELGMVLEMDEAMEGWHDHTVRSEGDRRTAG